MNLSITTDFAGGSGLPEQPLRLISEAGFTHIHWCHQWNSDYLYGIHEFEEFRRLLRQYGLKLLDIHGSAGNLKSWFSTEEYRRKSGVELVINRIRMLDELEGSGALVMHPPRIKNGMTEQEKQVIRDQAEAVIRSLDELMPCLEKSGRKIALENLPADDYSFLEKFLKRYPAERLGLTYDSGHGNMDTRKGLDFIESHKDRLEALHLHDNDGSGDQHKPLFTGTVDWSRLADILVRSHYKETGRPLSFELAMRNTPFFEPDPKLPQTEEKMRGFLADAYERCTRFRNMVKTAESGAGR